MEAKVDQHNEYQAQCLVIQNMSVLETAPAVVAEVEKLVFAKIDERIRTWVEKQHQWEGVFEGFLEEETTFKPKSWPINDSGEYCAYYTLGCDKSDGDDFEYWLSTLVGAVDYKFGIKFGVSTSYVTRLSGKGARPSQAWKAFLAKEYAERPQLKEAGFQLHGEFLFFPLHIDAAALASAYPDSLEEALGPMDESLEQISKMHRDVDQLLSVALERQFTKSTSSQ